MKNLLIIGAGGHGRVVAEVAEDCGSDELEIGDKRGWMASLSRR